MDRHAQINALLERVDVATIYAELEKWKGR
jgi:hypothetical protein